MSRVPPERALGIRGPAFAISPLLLLPLLVLLAAPLAAASKTAAGTARIQAEGPAVVKARTAALLVSEMSGGPIRTEVLALPWPEPVAASRSAGSSEDRRPVMVRVEIDGRSLLEPAAEGTIALEVFLYALGADGEVVESVTLRFAFDPQRHGEVARAGGLAVVAALELPPGEHRLRHLVWGDSQRFGLGTTPVDVPAEPRPVVWIAERPDRWLEVGPPDGAMASPLASASGLPVLSSSEERAEAWWLVPADQEGADGGQVRWQALSPGPGARGQGPAPAAHASEGDSPVSVPFEVLERRRTPVGSLLLRVAFPVPEIATGRYGLRLLPESGAPSAELPVWVAPPGTEEAWPRILPEVPRSEEEPLDDLDAAPTPRRSGVKTLAAGPELEAWQHRQRGAYRSVAMRLGAGDPEEAARELARIERDALGTAEAADLGTVLAALTEVQRETAAELLGPRAEGAPALALLHAAAARRHFESGRWPLASRAIEQAIWLAEGFAEIAGTRQARQDAAALLTWMAVDLRTASQGNKARELFRRSLELEESDAALLGLATLEERSGSAAEAVQTLERLVERSPGHREGRLRLAVNLVRTGRADRARDLLRRLVRTPDRSWVTAVAFQELARLELADGDCTGGVRVLRQARDLFPDQPQIAVQMAWALECAGEIAASRQLAANIVERARRQRPTDECPRMRYTRWNDEALASERRRLAELDRESRQALARVAEPLGEGR